MSYKVLLTEDIENSGKEYLKKFGYEIKLAPDISEDTLIREVEDCDAILYEICAYLINTARGEVVDNDELVEALLNKKIAGAAIDVF